MFPTLTFKLINCCLLEEKMEMDINKLRRLIRTGEFLENNITDEKIRNQWIFDVENFLQSLERKKEQQISSVIFQYKNTNFSLQRDNIRYLNHYHGLVMGFLRSLYNEGNKGDKPIGVNSQSVFIVHGHDDSLIESVKQCVSSLSLDPIVLREQANNGQTIIEKLEDWLSNCKCAVILYTPCDVGFAVANPEKEKRARQNVVYEHGLFQGYLGRKRIIVLRKDDTILPGDCSGMVYISTDTDTWQNELIKNIEAIDQS